MALEPYKQVFANAWRWWGEDQVPRLSAALTFYAMLSMAPMLLLAVATAGFVLGEESARASLVEEIKRSMGEAQSTFVASLLKTQTAKGGLIAAIFGLGVLIMGASGLFEQLRASVNAIWGLTAPEGGFLVIVRRKLFGILGVIVTAVVLLAWMIMDARLQWLSKQTIDEVLPLWKAVSFLLSWLFAAIAFAALFKFMPRKQIQWRDVLFPAIFTSLAFAVGKYLLTLYFAFASVSVAYGAAGALVVILLWVYYSSQIMFFGVELSNAYAYSLGSLKGQPHDSETKIDSTGQVSECTAGEESHKEPPKDPPAPTPSLGKSLGGLAGSVSGLGKTIGDLARSFTGRKRRS